MDIDVIRRTITDQEKEMYCRKGMCFECGETKHMARYCPNKKKSQQQSQGYKRNQYKQNKPYNSNKPKQHFGRQKSYNKSRTPFARIAQFLDSDDKSEEEDTTVATVTTSKSGNKELNISDIAARTSCFTDDQCEEWVKEMKNLGVDF
jgi:predicted  nucleic acid-binding Zn-ribbon protein